MQATHTAPMRYRPSRALVLKFAVRRAAYSLTRRVWNLGRRTVDRVRIAWLTYKIDSTAQYLAECAVDGLDLSLSMQDFIARMSADIDERAALRASF